MKKLNIVVTGGSGFIGRNLVPALKKDHVVINIDLEEDLSIFDSGLSNFIAMADVVIHLAALTSVQESFKESGEYFKTNVLGTALVIEACIRHNKKIIYPSSAAVLNPFSSPYAESKWMAEQLVLYASESIPVTILRLFNVFGRYMKPESGSIMYNFVHDDKLKINGDGLQTRDFIHVRDVVDIFEKSLLPSWNGELIDVGTGKETSIKQVAEIFSKLTNKKIVYRKQKKEVVYSVANIQTLKKLYKKKLTTNLEADIEELLYTDASVTN